MDKAEKFYREKCDVITKELHARDKEIIKLLEEYEFENSSVCNCCKTAKPTLCDQCVADAIEKVIE